MDIAQLLNINESLKQTANNSSSSSVIDPEILKTLVEKLIESKQQTSQIVSSGHPGFANAYKIQGVSEAQKVSNMKARMSLYQIPNEIITQSVNPNRKESMPGGKESKRRLTFFNNSRDAEKSLQISQDMMNGQPSIY